jgi:hypothetical protein
LYPYETKASWTLQSHCSGALNIIIQGSRLCPSRDIWIHGILATATLLTHMGFSHAWWTSQPPDSKLADGILPTLCEEHWTLKWRRSSLVPSIRISMNVVALHIVRWSCRPMTSLNRGFSLCFQGWLVTATWLGPLNHLLRRWKVT